MSRAEFIKLVTESSEVRTWADAKALFWLRRHACNSCIDSTPSIYMILVDRFYLGVLQSRHTFSRSCFTSARLTPSGTLSSRIVPLFLTGDNVVSTSQALHQEGHLTEWQC
jgi:hypothetical protein